jgi:hypothetical protein
MKAYSKNVEGMPLVVYSVIEMFVSGDVNSVDAVWALQALKIVLAIEEALFEYLEQKLDTGNWETKYGVELRNWIRGALFTFSRRFRDDFMIIEVSTDEKRVLI